MDLRSLHFAQPLWFWTLCVIPLVWGLFFLHDRKQQPRYQLEKLIDKHLIPHLLSENAARKKKLWPQLLLWSLVWSCLTLALAGPRWNFREVDTFTRDQNLAILLDLSGSMDANDISPSRLGRAKQKIEDLLHMSKGVKVGLIAFAADPHMIVPMTEDKETVRHLLPTLSTALVHVQGSKLAPALEMAATMLENSPGNNRAIVVISDGGFEDTAAIHTAKKLAQRGIVLHTIGVGTLEGAPLKDRQGAVVKKNGAPVITRLEKEKFREISTIGRGHYFDADHSGQIARLFEDLEKRSDVEQQVHKIHRVWEEHFPLFLLPVIPFFLFWFRRGSIFALLLFIPLCSHASLSHYFQNTEQRASEAYETKDYAAAASTFEDPYRKGVALYRMGDYSAAEAMFRQSTRPEVACSAAYNLGNALAEQNKLHDAIAAYEDVLKQWPDHVKAKENLEIVKTQLDQQKQQEQKDSDPKQNSQDPEKSREKQQSAEKKADDSEKQENPDAEKSPQNPPEDKSAPQETQEPPPQEQTLSSRQENEKPAPRSQEDQDADLWLNQIKNDPQSFLKNKFYLESRKNGTKEEVDPW